MTEVGVVFEVLEEEMKAPIGWSKVTGHLVWDVKMDFTRKARWVLDGHKTPNPIGSTYAGVWTFLPPTLGMPTYKCRAPRKITSCVALNLESKMLGRLL
jgi:hypothetical protein